MILQRFGYDTATIRSARILYHTSPCDCVCVCARAWMRGWMHLWGFECAYVHVHALGAYTCDNESYILTDIVIGHGQNVRCAWQRRILLQNIADGIVVPSAIWRILRLCNIDIADIADMQYRYCGHAHLAEL